MATIQELKDRIDLHDLADKLGLKRPGNRGNYRSPHRKDLKPSLEIGTKKSGGKGWVDWASGDTGTCVDLVMYVEGCDVGQAVKRLHELYGLPLERKPEEPKRERSKVEYIADQCRTGAARALEYLLSRKISEEAVRRAIKAGTLGFNDWTSKKVGAGEVGYGGPAVAFIVKSMNPGHDVAVDLRYLDPQLNGGVKTMTQGDKEGIGWTSSLRKLEEARTVVIVESAVNALTVDSCDLPYTAAIATRGVANAGLIDWRFMQGKKALICMDNDPPFPDEHKLAGHCPGQEAAWTIHERLTALDVAALMVDQADWYTGKEDAKEPLNDLNDLAQAKGLDEVRIALKKLEPWLIPGLWGKGDQLGRSRVFLPGHDFAQYWRFRLKEDFTTHIDEVKKSDEGDETPQFSDLCGFRLASLSRVTISSAVSTMTGDPDSQPRVMFAISVQAPRHGPKLLRRVVDDEKLHNIDQWKRFGPVFNQSRFLRMVNILERTAHIGARRAANFVGLCWRDGRLIVNEGPDCYFTNPEQQCPYHNLTFPSGPKRDGVKVLDAYQATFKKNAAALPLVWALGGHLKALLGFWPHLVMQAQKGSGKSTFTKRLERSIGMTMFSGQSLNTEFRLLTSISHTSHAVGWEELSARRVDVIDKAVSLLQESYQYTINRRGAELTEFLLSAPVMLAGEDVPVKSLTGKLIRTELTDKQGPLMPEDLPRFPVRQWLEYLARLDRKQVAALFLEQEKRCKERCRAAGTDPGAMRMMVNYAAVLVAWRTLCDFLELGYDYGDFEQDLAGEMNGHIRGTSADRHPWVWIVETLLSEIARKEFRYPHVYDLADGEPCLLVRTSHVMDHIAHTSSLRDKWNQLPIKTDRVFKRDMATAGVLLMNEDGTEPKGFERQFGDPMHGQRVSHMVAISLTAIQAFGLYGTPSS